MAYGFCPRWEVLRLPCLLLATAQLRAWSKHCFVFTVRITWKSCEKSSEKERSYRFACSRRTRWC